MTMLGIKITRLIKRPIYSELVIESIPFFFRPSRASLTTFRYRAIRAFYFRLIIAEQKPGSIYAFETSRAPQTNVSAAHR